MEHFIFYNRNANNISNSKTVHLKYFIYYLINIWIKVSALGLFHICQSPHENIAHQIKRSHYYVWLLSIDILS